MLPKLVFLTLANSRIEKAICPYPPKIYKNSKIFLKYHLHSSKAIHKIFKIPHIYIPFYTTLKFNKCIYINKK